MSLTLRWIEERTMTFEEWKPYAQTKAKLYNDEEEYLSAVKYEWRKLVELSEGVIERTIDLSEEDTELLLKREEIWDITFCERCDKKERRACEKALYPNSLNQFRCRECLDEEKMINDYIAKAVEAGATLVERTEMPMPLNEGCCAGIDALQLGKRIAFTKDCKGEIDINRLITF